MWGLLFALIDGIAFPTVRDAASPFQILGLFMVFHVLFLFVMLIGSTVLLLRLKWLSAVCYFASASILVASSLAALALKGDRFAFTAGPHREIADIYYQRRSEFAVPSPDPRFFALKSQCRPPSGCECWVLVDLAHTSGVEREIGGWRRAQASIFIDWDAVGPKDFAIVNVKQIDSNAYSILGCSADWTALKPL
jgi:hypothetical protein